MKTKRYSLTLTPYDVLDVVLMWEQRGVLTKFALNYRAQIHSKWHEIYRVDNYHGFLHEQKFWRSSRPIPIVHHQGWPVDSILEEYRNQIIENFEKYRSYFERELVHK